MIDTGDFWTVTLILGAATYAIRLSFLALTEGREIPETAKRLLDFVPVTVLPALIAPIIVFPERTGGEVEIERLLAAAIALAVGIATRRVMSVIVAGMAALWLLRWFLG